MARGVCVYGCTGPARLYPGGWRCVAHQPPPPPVPPPGTTAADLRDRPRDVSG
jgi:hypothetical protein